MDASGKPGASFFVRGQGSLAPSNAVVAVWGASYALGA